MFCLLPDYYLTWPLHLLKAGFDKLTAALVLVWAGRQMVCTEFDVIEFWRLIRVHFSPLRPVTKGRFRYGYELVTSKLLYLATSNLKEKGNITLTGLVSAPPLLSLPFRLVS